MVYLTNSVSGVIKWPKLELSLRLKVAIDGAFLTGSSLQRNTAVNWYALDSLEIRFISQVLCSFNSCSRWY